MLKKIKKIIKTKDGRTIIENFISLSALQLIGMVLPLITLPYILRVIGFEKYGLIIFAASLIAYFQSLTDFSFRITATRDVAFFRNNPKKLNIIYSKVLIIKSLFLVLSWLIIALIVFSYSPFSENSLIYFFSSLMLLGYALFPEWFFQGIEKMRYITYLNLGIKTFFTICIFIFIRSEKDFWIYPLLQSLGYIGAGIIGQIFLLRKYNLRFVPVSYKIISYTIRKNTPIFISQFVPNLFNNTTIFILGFFVEKSVLGVFNAVKSIILIEYSILNSLSTAFFPYNVRNGGKFDKFLNIAMLMLVLMIIGTVLLKPVIFWYLNIVDSQYDLILYILLFGLFFVSISTIFSVNFLYVIRKDKLVMRNTTIASIVGLILSYPLISNFGVLGGSFTIIISQFLMGSFSFYYYRKLNKIAQ